MILITTTKKSRKEGYKWKTAIRDSTLFAVFSKQTEYSIFENLLWNSQKNCAHISTFGQGIITEKFIEIAYQFHYSDLSWTKI